MADTTIRIAYSKSKSGFTAYSYESTTSPYYTRPLKSGWHIASEDTLEDAIGRVQAAIRHDYLSLGLTIPPIVECGKVSAAMGKAYLF